MKKKFSILITIAIIVLLYFTLRDINFSEINSTLNNVTPFYFLLAILSSFAAFLTWNIRFKKTLSGFIEANYFYLSLVSFTGVFLNIITPGTGVGGEPIMAHFLKKKYNKPKSKILGYIAADKIISMITFLIFVVFSFILIFFFLETDSKAKFIPSISILVILSILGIILLKYRKNILNPKWISSTLLKFPIIRKRFHKKSNLSLYLEESLNNFFSVFHKVIHNKKKLLSGIYLSTIFWIFIFLTSFFLFKSFGYSYGLIPIVITVTLSQIIGEISPSPGGIGVMEGSMIILYSSFGVPATIATVVAILSRFIYYLFALLVGGLSLIYLKLKYK